MNEGVFMTQTKRIIIDCLHGKNIDLSKDMDKLNPIIKIGQIKFPNVNFNPVTKILQLAGNTNNKGNFILDSNRMFLDAQDPENLVEIYKLYADMWTVLKDSFKIETFSRIGIRNFITLEKSNPNLIDSIIMNEFIKPDVSQFNKYGNTPEKIHFGFTTSCDYYKINHNFGTFTTQEVNINSGIIKNTIKNYLLYDVDFYIDTITNSNELGKIFDDAQKQIDLCTHEYFSNLGGKL